MFNRLRTPSVLPEAGTTSKKTQVPVSKTKEAAVKSPEENTYFLLVYIGKHWLVWTNNDGDQAVSDNRAEVEEFRKQFKVKHPKGYSRICIGSVVHNA